MIRLFTTVYPEIDAKRRAEYVACLGNNIGCENIDEICIFEEGASNLVSKDPKLQVRPVSRRPHYGEIFSWINETVLREDISIIANTDIYFDENLRALEFIDLQGRCLALSRWDVLVNGKANLFEYGDSQDCWIFQGKILPVRGDFPLGAYDCDNKIAWELERAGYEVANPSLSLRSYHLHQTTLRSYDPASPADHGIRPPFKFVEPDNIGSFKECFRLWRQARMTYFPWRFTWKKWMRTPPIRLALRVSRKVRRMIG